ncbi:MAG: amidohydrolase [Flavobacteriales bacterium]|nr:amidohydrolase [Flavobacteriales bacterium]
MSGIIDKIKVLCSEYFEEIREVRRHIHANPELSFHEYETSKYICDKLDQLGIPYKNGYVKTGILARIEGRAPEKKTIALRADIDALPIKEANDVPYRSTNDGVMHACGHDVHSSSLLGAAMILNELKNEWEGTVLCVFQPGEEKIPGGASLMLKEGVFDNYKPTGIIGQHVFPDLEVGKVGFKGGQYMASADELYLTVHGKGGHGALPHQNIDPVLIASYIIVSLQQLVSRKAKPDVPTVLSFGKIQGLGATNIIPDKVELEGTFRTMNEEWRYVAHKEITKIAEGIAESMGAKCEVNILKGYPCLWNDEDMTSKNINAAKQFMGTENVVDLDLRMTSEDFAFYTLEMPGCFYRLGTSNKEKGINAPIHNAHFNIDEEALKTGMGLMAWMAINELNS